MSEHPPMKPMPECSASTPRAELERQIMDASLPKNEREWWARGEITRLRSLVNQTEYGLIKDTP